MSLQGKTFAVLIEDIYEDQELWYPTIRLREAGAKVILVGPEKGKTYKSKHGYPAVADEQADQVDVSRLEGVIIPGGFAPDKMRRHDSMVQLVRQAYESDKLVAAICHAGWMLCSADILRGKTVTSFSAIKVDMINAGAEWVDQEVVQDGKLITSRTPDDLPAFMKAVLNCCS